MNFYDSFQISSNFVALVDQLSFMEFGISYAVCISTTQCILQFSFDHISLDGDETLYSYELNI